MSESSPPRSSSESSSAPSSPVSFMSLVVKPSSKNSQPEAVRSSRPPPKKPYKKSRIDNNSCSGLRQVTYQVIKKLRAMDTSQVTTYEKVAKSLAEEYIYCPGGPQNKREERNMRRRAYDVMNVLMAVGYIRRVNSNWKEFVFVGELDNLGTIVRFERERSRRQTRIAHKREQLEALLERIAEAEEGKAKTRSRQIKVNPDHDKHELIQIKDEPDRDQHELNQILSFLADFPYEGPVERSETSQELSVLVVDEPFYDDLDIQDLPASAVCSSENSIVGQEELITYEVEVPYEKDVLVASLDDFINEEEEEYAIVQSTHYEEIEEHSQQQPACVVASAYGPDFEANALFELAAYGNL